MHRSFFSLSLNAAACFAMLVVVVNSSPLRAEDVSSAFQDIPFEKALQQAQKEHKIVFVDFFTTWCGPCKMLDATTWRDPAVIALLTEKTIALKIDAEKNISLAKRYSVEAYPTLVLIRPDGTKIDSLVGYQDTKKFMENFESSLSGTTSLTRAREAVKKTQGDFSAWVQARCDLGAELVKNGKEAEALAEYLWCFDEGMKKAEGYGGVRLSFLLLSIANLGKHYPPAIDALKVRRDQARTELSASPGDAAAALDFSRINHVLGEDEVTLSYFDKLPPESPARAALGGSIFDLLLAAQRYGDAVSARPYPQFQAQFRNLKAMPPPPGEPNLIRGFIITSAAKELEALAGAGKLEDARDLLKTTLEYDHSAETIATMHEHLERAGHLDLMPSGVESARPSAK